MVECCNQHVVASAAFTSEYTVSTQGDIWCGTGEAIRVDLGSNNTSNVGAVAATVIGIVVRNGLFSATSVGVADEISTETNEAALSKAATEGRVVIVDTCVDNSHFDTSTPDATSAELVHLGHDVRREGVIVRRLTLVDCVESRGRSSVAVSGPMHFVVGNRVLADRPHLLDFWHGCDLLRHLFF